MQEPMEAMKWLRKAATNGFPNYSWFARDPNLDSLRQNEDFKAFVAEQEKQWKRFNETL